MVVELDYPGQFDDEIEEQPDGSFTVTLSPWCEEPLTGIPTRDLALRFCYVAHKAMESYAYNAMTE